MSKSSMCHLHKKLQKICITKLFYKEYGEPVKVLQQLDEDLEYELRANEVLVKMLAAPVNPQDVNIIEGKYPVRPPLPSIPGNEGVGEIIQIGEEVKCLSVGDRVVPVKSQLGTWRSHLICSPSHLLKVPEKLGLVESATFTVNPCTAYRLLRDYAQLKPGDSVIQNGANSACGQNVIQLGRVMRLKTVNVVRSRDDIDALKQYLKKLGADYVLTEDELNTTDIFKRELKRPTLGFNCVGGKSGMRIIRHMDANSVLVTYGGMAREPVMIPTGSLIFKKLKATGFWLNDWLEAEDNAGERQKMHNDIIQLMIGGELKGPNHRIIPFTQYKEAVSNTLNKKGMVGIKFILKFVNDA